MKLRRTPCDAPRPASTPPVIAASAIKDEDDEEKIIAELEVRAGWPFCFVFYIVDFTLCLHYLLLSRHTVGIFSSGAENHTFLGVTVLKFAMCKGFEDHGCTCVSLGFYI